MSWERTCCASTTSSNGGSGGYSASSTFSPPSLTGDYDVPPPPPPSSFFFFSSLDYNIDDQSTREREKGEEEEGEEEEGEREEEEEREENDSLPLHEHPHLYSPVFSSRANVSDTCFCSSNSHYPAPSTSSLDISSSSSSSSSSHCYFQSEHFQHQQQSSFIYEQYLSSLKSEQSEHLPYLFDNIIYPQPCSPPSPSNDSITYFQLDPPASINSFPRSTPIQPIIYQQLSLVEPPSSSLSNNHHFRRKPPTIKRFYYDSHTSTTTAIMTTATPAAPPPPTTIETTTTTNGDNNVSLPYARLDSAHFGTYDIWQEKTIVGRKNNRREVDVNMGSSSVVSRVHFELILVGGNEFQLKCLSKNGIFVNNNYTKMAASTVLPKQCTLRFPSTELCITFSSLLNNNNSISRTPPQNVSRHVSTDTLQPQPRLPSTIPSSSIPLPMDISGHPTTPALLLQSVPSFTPQQQQQQQVILVAVNQHLQRALSQQNNHESISLPPLSINVSNSSSPSAGSSFSASSSTGLKLQHESPTAITTNNSILCSSISPCSTSPKNNNSDLSESQAPISSPIISRLPSSTDVVQQEHEGNPKTGTKPPFSYAQLIVQAILSAPDKQMTLSQIYNFISAQYPYYEANNRGWQNSIRHNLSLNRYFIRLARKENESGKGSFWRLDQTCEEKLIDHAFRHRKQRGGSNSSSNGGTNLMMKNENVESEEIHSPTAQFASDQTDFLLADIHTSGPSTPLSPMTSPIAGPMIEAISPARQSSPITIQDNEIKVPEDDETIVSNKRKRSENEDDPMSSPRFQEAQAVLTIITEHIVNEIAGIPSSPQSPTSSDTTGKRQKKLPEVPSVCY